MFDTHCHLQSLSALFSSSSSFPTPNSHYLVVSTHCQEWQKTLTIAHNNKSCLPAVGIHPWFVSDTAKDDLTALSLLLNRYKVAALGEIGLDFSQRYKMTKALQIRVFEQQLLLANKFNLPISIHCIKAHNDMLRLLKKHSLIKKGVMHGLGTSLQMAKNYLDLGYKIGLNAVICRDNAVRYHKMIKNFDLKDFVLETDYPNIPLPGNNTPALSDINVVAEHVAQHKKCTVQAVEEQTDFNALQIFKESNDFF